MKILHVVPSFGLGGMEKIICGLINAIPGGICQEVLALNGHWDAQKWVKNNQVRYLDFFRPRGNAAYCKGLYSALRRSSPDLMMTYNWGATDAIWLGRLAGISHIIHSEHGFNVDEAAATNWKRNVIRYLVYRLSSKIIVVSQYLHKMMVSKFSLNPASVHFIPNGIDAEYYVPNEYEREKIRGELGIQATDLVIGYSGRLDPVKNFSLFMEVCARCIKSNAHIKVLIIGEGPERAFIEKFSRMHQIESQVVLTGLRPQVLPYLRSLDIFMLTSFREQMPMSMLEAMAVGVPVVGSDVGEIPTVLQDRSAGYVCRLEDGVEPFIESIFRLTDSGRRKEMGQRARSLIVNQFEEISMIRQYIDLFEEVLGNPNCFSLR